MAIVTIREVLFVYYNAHQAFKCFTSMGINRHQARNTVVLLLWLEQNTDLQDLALQNVLDFSAQTLKCLAAEANSILECLRGESMSHLPFPDIPFISSLCRSNSIDPGFFIYQQNIVARGVDDIINGVGVFIFDDSLYRLYNRYNTGLFPHFPELEAPYTVRHAMGSEDCRSMFITFSRGQPVEREEIFEYFREQWGDCIVRVLMEKTSGGAQSMYGRIIFKSEVFVSLVLNGEKLVSVTINNREIWLRRYIPRNNI